METTRSSDHRLLWLELGHQFSVKICLEKVGKSKPADSENQFRQEDFFPVVISLEDWQTVQLLLK